MPNRDTPDDDQLNEYYTKGEKERQQYLVRQLQSALEQHKDQRTIDVETLTNWCLDVSGHANPKKMEGDIIEALKQLQTQHYIEDYTEWHSGELTLGDRFESARDDAAADVADEEDLLADPDDGPTRREQLQNKETRRKKLDHIKKHIKTVLATKPEHTFKEQNVIDWGGHRSGVQNPSTSELVDEALDELHKDGYINREYGAKRIRVLQKLMSERKELLLEESDLDDIKRSG